MPRDDQYEAEVTDSDEIDPLDFPADRPMGVDDLLRGDVMAAGDYAPDTLRMRSRRLDTAAGDSADPRVIDLVPGGITSPGDGQDEAATERGPGDWDVIDPGGVLADSCVAGHRRIDSWPAEEAALHLTDDTPPDDMDPLPHPIGADRGTGAGDRRTPGHSR
jgi:hypothetical protein